MIVKVTGSDRPARLLRPALGTAGWWQIEWLPDGDFDLLDEGRIIQVIETPVDQAGK
jgi:hypothetical protein